VWDGLLVLLPASPFDLPYMATPNGGACHSLCSPPPGLPRCPGHPQPSKTSQLQPEEDPSLGDAWAPLPISGPGAPPSLGPPKKKTPPTHPPSRRVGGWGACSAHRVGVSTQEVTLAHPHQGWWGGGGGAFPKPTPPPPLSPRPPMGARGPTGGFLGLPTRWAGSRDVGGRGKKKLPGAPPLGGPRYVGQ
jgi:hypothetical protein